MSRLHLKVKCLDWLQSVCTASTDSKSKKTWWEWRKLTYKVHYTMGYMCFGGVFVALEVYLGLNDTSRISCSLSKLASYKSKNIILDWMVDFSWARTSIRGQEIPGRESCSFAMNTWAVPQYLTLCDADLDCAQTSMISQKKLQLHYKWVSQCLIFWQKYSISPRLSILPLWLANMQESIVYMDMDLSLSGAPELRSNTTKSCGFASSEWAVSHVRTEVLNIT